MSVFLLLCLAGGSCTVCVAVHFTLYVYVSERYLFANDEDNELSISRSILSITVQSRLSA